jgi:hypothetical protein
LVEWELIQGATLKTKNLELTQAQLEAKTAAAMKESK